MGASSSCGSVEIFPNKNIHHVYFVPFIIGLRITPAVVQLRAENTVASKERKTLRCGQSFVKVSPGSILNIRSRKDVRMYRTLNNLVITSHGQCFD